MEKEIELTFIKQIKSFSSSLAQIINERNLNKGLIMEKMKFFLELKYFVVENCNEKVKSHFEKIPPIDEKLFFQIDLYTTIKFVLILAFFLASIFDTRKRKKEDELIAYLQSLRTSMANVVNYYELNGKFD